MLTIIWTSTCGIKYTSYWTPAEAQDRINTLNKLLEGSDYSPNWTAEKEAMMMALESSVYAQDCH